MVFRTSIVTYLFFFNETATTEIYTLSLHDALPICSRSSWRGASIRTLVMRRPSLSTIRSEEHTSELQSRENLVCRLLPENKKTNRLKLGFTQWHRPYLVIRVNAYDN